MDNFKRNHEAVTKIFAAEEQMTSHEIAKAVQELKASFHTTD